MKPTITELQAEHAADPKKKFRHTALSSRVLAVLSVGPDGWRMYVDAVPGKDHDVEWHLVASQGQKQREAIARAILETHFYIEADAEYVL